MEDTKKTGANAGLIQPAPPDEHQLRRFLGHPTEQTPGEIVPQAPAAESLNGEEHLTRVLPNLVNEHELRKLMGGHDDARRQVFRSEPHPPNEDELRRVTGTSHKTSES
jgi:hypothetical protein